MKVFLKGFLSRYIQTRTRYNSRNPRPAPIDRRIFEIITQPVYKEMLELDLTKSCSVMKYRKIDDIADSGTIKKNLYEEFLKNELLSLFSQHKMIICCHHDKMNIQRMIKIRNILLFEQINITFFPSDVVRNSLINTKWHNMIPLFTDHTGILLCKEEKISQLLNLTKKIGDITVLGGLVGNRLYTKQGLINRSKLSTPTDLLTNTVALLQNPTNRTVNLITQHQQLLIFYLKQFVRQ